MDSTVSHDELSSKLKLAVLGVISTALAGKKGRIIQYPFQFFRITHNLNTVALMMKFCSTWALRQILHRCARDDMTPCMHAHYDTIRARARAYRIVVRMHAWGHIITGAPVQYLSQCPG